MAMSSIRPALPVFRVLMLGWTPLAFEGCIPRPIVESAPDVEYASSITARSSACGLTTGGEVYCWTRRDPRPTLISGSLQFAQISLSDGHGCGVITGGTAYCWGTDTFGQLGLGEENRPSNCQATTSSWRCGLNPVADQAPAFLEVHTGREHTCGLAGDGTAYCWGANLSGQIGSATANDCYQEFVEGGLPCAHTPVAIPGIAFSSISTGSEHTCGIEISGQALCWGFGGSGRLGTGSTESTGVPSRVLGDIRFRSISAGGAHTCAVTDDGTAYCWGSNADMQLGSSETDPDCGGQIDKCFATPMIVASQYRFQYLTASMGSPYNFIGGHTCGLSQDARVFCWGLNESGQLARYNDLRSKHPVEVSNELRFLQISAGLDNTCGVTTNARIVCWAEGGPVDSWYHFQ